MVNFFSDFEDLIFLLKLIFNLTFYFRYFIIRIMPRRKNKISLENGISDQIKNLAKKRT
jgi:hypothetical protein